jgi:hypothetical protein
MGLHGDGDGGRILPEAENEDGDGEYFRWWVNLRPVGISAYGK